MPVESSISQEIKFWNGLETELKKIEEQLQSKPAQMTFAILKRAKRFHATQPFDTDTIGLKVAAQKAQDYKSFTKNFPIHELESAVDVQAASKALVDIFAHMKKSKQNSKYPLQRYIRVGNALSRDLCQRVAEILRARRILRLDFVVYNKLIADVHAVFDTWEKEFAQYEEMLRSIRHNRNQVKFSVTFDVSQIPSLMERVTNVSNFREQHEQLASVVKKVLGAKSSHALREIDEAYSSISGVDPLDMADENLWAEVTKQYDLRIDRVEAQITATLRDRLAVCKNSNEMFSVFSQFNALFVRARVRSAIKEYQNILVSKVKEDIAKLFTQLKEGYQNSSAFKMAQIRDIPPVSGSIMWAKSLLRQLDLYMTRVEHVLGPSWHVDVEGQQLRADGDRLRNKLDTKKRFDEWAEATKEQVGASIAGKEYQVVGPVFQINKTGNTLSVEIKFEKNLITLFKEVRNMEWLGFRVPIEITMLSGSVQHVYPYAVSLKQILKTYLQTRNKVTPAISSLIQGFDKAVQQELSPGFRLQWDSLSKLKQFVPKLLKVVNVFHDRVLEALQLSGRIEEKVEELSACSYSEESFQGVLQGVQELVDQLNLADYSNLGDWVEELESRVQEKLGRRLETAIAQFQGLMEEGGKKKGANKETDVVIQKMTHKIVIRNQVMVLVPPLRDARINLTNQLSAHLSVICSRDRLKASRYDQSLSLASSSRVHRTYRVLLRTLPENCLSGVYALIDARLEECRKYVATWLQYQNLWDMDQSIYAQVGKELGPWQQLIKEVRSARAVFDNSKKKQVFFPVEIDYATVKQSVNNKYDFWHRELVHHFAEQLASKMGSFYNEILKLRMDMEKLGVENENTQNAVKFIIDVQNTKKQVEQWDEDLRDFDKAQHSLIKQRFVFPKDWLEFSQVEAEYSTFLVLLGRREKTIQAQIPLLQEAVHRQRSQLESAIEKCVSDWGSKRPTGEDDNFSQSMGVIKIFLSRINVLNMEWVSILRAEVALKISDAYVDEDENHAKLGPLREEVFELSEVWNALAGIYEPLELLRQIPFPAIVPRKVRKELDLLLDSMGDMSVRVKQYEAFDKLKEKLTRLLQLNGLVLDLKSEALRDRHWRQIFKSLNVKWVLSELTLGHLWTAFFKKGDKMFRKVVTRAQGELALEIFIKQVEEYWGSFVVDLVSYRNKCKLIRGWDDMFAKMSDHMNSISAMKMSPFYKVFATEADKWDEQLNKIYTLFDAWIDVQRIWVYLEGIFSNSSEISQLLPVQSNRFKTINNEFLSLMRNVSLRPLILDILNIEGIQKSVERLSGLLTKIQKALGEYVEKQRAAFPRFYFVGDEDLLEIIGSSGNVPKIMKHFKKMFAGINSVSVDEQDAILSMISVEGEEIAFSTPVVTKKRKIHEWLHGLEDEMRRTLKDRLLSSLEIYKGVFENLDGEAILQWLDNTPAQICLLCIQLCWCEGVEKSLNAGQGVKEQLAKAERLLECLALNVVNDLTPIARKKHESMITEFVHQRDILRQMAKENVQQTSSFLWLSQMRYYVEKKGEEEALLVRMANAEFAYGWEYLGVADKLVQTPLTDRCYLTLTQALHGRFGGSPAGPAGTGKTESVKALAGLLGRFALVFCCDENFDFKAMGRIFVGLFDEFNRLEERMLSAVSQQIQLIQEGLGASSKTIKLGERTISLGAETGIFITMNPGYAGRQNLPDNLKQLFRGVAMIKPDRELIGQVMLFSQGFKTAERLSGKVVPLFTLCKEQLSAQSHYDFGLRALKSVLVSAGNLKRKVLREKKESAGDDKEEEELILIRSICETVQPKLVQSDMVLFDSLLSDVFPGGKAPQSTIRELVGHVEDICKERFLVASDKWLEKVLQLYQTVVIRHGVMMVGPSGGGKTSAWSVLLAALERWDGIESLSYVVNAKAMHKNLLFGSLEATTREWTDGLFTHILRKILENVRGEAHKRHWIVFDGDVDPEWVENLNSVLDDNKLLTLPNGERLQLPDNIRILFEVDNLRYATPATVSRCGMVWFSDDIVSTEMVLKNYLLKLRDSPLLEEEREVYLLKRAAARAKNEAEEVSDTVLLQRSCGDQLRKSFAMDGDDGGSLISECFRWCAERWHIMDPTRLRLLTSMFSVMNAGIVKILEYNKTHPDFPMDDAKVKEFVRKHLIYSILWGFAGSMEATERSAFGAFLKQVGQEDDVNIEGDPQEYFVQLEQASWRKWNELVPTIEIETHQAASPDIVIPTIDTLRNEHLISSFLTARKPLILCGPPGSGKTMTLFSTLKKMEGLEVVTLNFSSATSPELILSTFEHYCEYRTTSKGTFLRPTVPSKWLVLFCDEINLPERDSYGTQRVITFLRQLTEKNGFWRASDHVWVTLERIQFVGACNPPTDPGRVPLTARFLRFSPVIMVGFPSLDSLRMIYSTMNRALLKLVPELRGEAKPLTEAMVDVYSVCQKKFTPDMHSHYIFSPRELSRWVRALYEAITSWENAATLNELVRLFVHEGLRLFHDRLVSKSEKVWFNSKIDQVAQNFFPNIDSEITLKRPILYSKWTSSTYASVKREDLREYIKQRLRIFYEEELDVPLVLFNEVLDHILRIDRVFRQPQGHALLIGVSGGGKTVLSRFVAWLDGLSVCTIKVNSRYTFEDFRQDLRHVMLRAGTKDEKICFIFDESNVVQSNFLELMNTLLASGDVPGLFEGEDYTHLMNACKEAVQKKGEAIDSEDLYMWFVKQVRVNLHVVFTMNPASKDFHNRSATSPALFNRCVLDWFGDWSPTALFQVGHEFTKLLDLEDNNYIPPHVVPDDVKLLLREVGIDSSKEIDNNNNFDDVSLGHRDAVISSLVFFHDTIRDANHVLLKKTGKHNYLTPRHFLDLIKQLVVLVGEKKEALEEQQRHVNSGLTKLKETEEEVSQLQKSLGDKRIELQQKNVQANEKLKAMVGDQQIAEAKKQESLKLQEVLKVKDAEIGLKKERAEADLAKAEPAVEEAKKSVSGIKPSMLHEIRALRKPPVMIQQVLEAVCIMLGKGKLAWDDIRKVLQDKNFITSILKFDSKNLSQKLREKMNAVYLSDPNFTFEKANRASKACGPLMKWMKASVEFSIILHSVAPLRQQVAELELASKDVRDKATELFDTIKGLEEKIAVYKQEYADLIRETELIKSELEQVGTKVTRSVSLLSKLSLESERWDEQSHSFLERLATIVGDCLLSAGFLSYLGVFDQTYRQSLVSAWKNRLESLGIRYSENTNFMEFLSEPKERLDWKKDSLPADELSVENAIMLKRYNRYPLIIDPSGQAITFLVNSKRSEGVKIIKTSFLDVAFQKNLESALRFGCALVVEDVENIDPILNPILNKEVRKSGGRVLITLGDKDVDVSPAFAIFLATRDPSAHFTPDLCSRVTFVNFTVTSTGLKHQCLHGVLRRERPDVENRSGEALKQQNELSVQLEQTERQLLDSLSQSKSNLLQDDKIMNTLEKLKTESEKISEKVKAAEAVMSEIAVITKTYEPIADICSDLYFVMAQLSCVHFLYQFSLTFFLESFADVIDPNVNTQLKEEKDPHKRVACMKSFFFSELYKRVSYSLLTKDRLVFALNLAEVKVKNTQDELDAAKVAYLLSAGESVGDSAKSGKIQEAFPQMGSQNVRMVLELEKEKGFAGLVDHLLQNAAEWKRWAKGAEEQEPSPWMKNKEEEDVSYYLDACLVHKAIKPSGFVFAVHQLVSKVFGKDFLTLAELDLENIVAIEQKEEKRVTPVLLCAAKGHDASGLVDVLARDLNAKRKEQIELIRIALGSKEGFVQADRSITAAAKTGNWVMLKNIHLAPTWLGSLEKKLYNLKAHPQFRLFLTSDVHPKLPQSLLRMARVLTFENPPGMISSLSHTLHSIGARNKAKFGQVEELLPVERSRLHFLLGWFHAVVTERLRYCPLGWSKLLEFNDTDLRCGLDTIDYWIDIQSKGKRNLSPAAMPWKAIKQLLSQVVYGGRIDNDIDQRLLDIFVEELFTEKVYEDGFALAGSVRVPKSDVKKGEEFVAWVNGLQEEEENPSWISLQTKAEDVLLASQGKELASNWLKMRALKEDEDFSASHGDAKEDAGRSQWMVQMEAVALKWKALLAEKKGLEQKKAEEVDEKKLRDPLWRFWNREERFLRELVGRIRRDLEELLLVCAGEIKQSNYIRALITDVSSGAIPKEWRKYYEIPSDVSATFWFLDMLSRVDQTLQKSASGGKGEVWLGGLFQPNAFVTASRQAAAQANGWSLESLELRCNKGKEETGEKNNRFVVTGLTMEGGLEQMEGELDLTLTWEPAGKQDSDNLQQTTMSVPLYVNKERKSLLLAARLPKKEDVDEKDLYKKGIALLSWKK